MTLPTIRRATLADAEALSRIGAETFTETFSHLYPPEDLAAFLEAAYAVEKSRRDLEDPDKAVWLVEAGGAVSATRSPVPATCRTKRSLRPAASSSASMS